MALESALPQINQRRANLSNPARQLPKRQPVWLFPMQVEVFYRNALQSRLDVQEEVINNVIIKNLDSIAFERDLLTPEASNADSFNTDNYAESIERLMITLRLSLGALPINTKTLAEITALRINDFNSKEWNKQIKAALGVPIFQREPWLNGTIDSFVINNVNLISKMDTVMVDSIGETMQREFRKGSTVATISQQIQKRVDVTKSHADLIARDQVGKLNGDLTRLRQTNLGIDQYIWRDSNDRRVRTTHIHNDGRTFRWDKPPAATGHPGEDYQCRCYAEPDFHAVFEELANS